MWWVSQLLNSSLRRCWKPSGSSPIRRRVHATLRSGDGRMARCAPSAVANGIPICRPVFCGNAWDARSSSPSRPGRSLRIRRLVWTSGSRRFGFSPVPARASVRWNFTAPSALRKRRHGSWRIASDWPFNQDHSARRLDVLKWMRCSSAGKPGTCTRRFAAARSPGLVVRTKRWSWASTGDDSGGRTHVCGPRA